MAALLRERAPARASDPEADAVTFDALWAVLFADGFFRPLLFNHMDDTVVPAVKRVASELSARLRASARPGADLSGEDDSH